MDRLCAAAPALDAPRHTVGCILRQFLPALVSSLGLGARARRLLWRLASCRTGELGANIFQCPRCHQEHWCGRSCGDRHCPQCLAAKSRQWLHHQQRSLLPVTYYHCVFTLPCELNALLRLNPARLYPLFFDCAAQSLLEFGRNRLGGDLGLSLILHTWGQQMQFHPHLHGIVTGGALSPEGQRWRAPKQRKFLFPVRALATLFRGKFLHGLRRLLQAKALRLPALFAPTGAAQQQWFTLLYTKRWVLYAKRPFGGPQQVLSYLSNYTHRVALSNRRIIAVDEQSAQVTFSYRDYRKGGALKALTLPAREFIRRFSLHLLPPRLVRIRHYGILANNRRQRDIAKARALLQRRGKPGPAPQTPALRPMEPLRCPRCGQLGLRWIGWIDAYGVRYSVRLRPPVLDSS
jgi:hypothetical protein